MINLTQGRARAIINPAGAWVEELSSGEQPILFPKTELTNDNGEGKTRGGMHVCLPNFGPGGDSGLAQHGFGRTSEWDIVGQSDDSVTLRLQSPAVYPGLEATLQYTLETHQLISSLHIKNTNQIPIRIAPGFHPYFHIYESETAVSINNKLYELSELAGTEFITTESIALKTSERSLSMAQENLSTWAIWTDGLASYVCVEPTYGGYRFLEPPTPDEQLASGADKSFSCTIEWR